MVDIVVIRIVAKEQLQRVKWEAVPAVVVDGLHRREREEEACLAHGHERE